MAQFIIEYRDLGVPDVREARRPEHIAYRKGLGGLLLLAGPLLDEAEKVVGSIVILEAADYAAASLLASQDPYVALGVMQIESVRRYRVAAMNPPGKPA